MCGKDDLWKLELNKRIKTGENVTLMALGDVKSELLLHLNRRKDVEIVRIETKVYEKRKRLKTHLKGFS